MRTTLIVFTAVLFFVLGLDTFAQTLPQGVDSSKLKAVRPKAVKPDNLLPTPPPPKTSTPAKSASKSLFPSKLSLGSWPPKAKTPTAPKMQPVALQPKKK